jgi:hypothetical protein
MQLTGVGLAPKAIQAGRRMVLRSLVLVSKRGLNMGLQPADEEGRRVLRLLRQKF